MVTPTRIVFSGRARSAEVALLNRGNAAATYRISFQNMRMTDEGRLEIVDEPGPDMAVADKLVRYSPRQVVLEPGQGQTVRLLVRKPRDLPPGEYRSHLLFRAIPPESAGADIEDLEEGEIRIQLIPIYGISIPVIVRHGDLSASVNLSDLALRRPPDKPPVLAMRINRSGNSSVYGEFSIVFMAEGGAQTEVAFVGGIAVYTSIQSRAFELTLRPPEGLELSNGRLKVIYRKRPDQGGTVLAEAEISLQ